jgi:phospholipid/cholesterol/gamma-HCH transport system substrate-binding protein
MTRRAQLSWARVKVGALVVTALAILTAVILNLEEGMGLLGRKTTFRAVVHHTQGLKIGSPVRMNGVDIGNVHTVAIAERTPQVEITFTVQDHVAPHIRQDASISIRALGLLGDKYLEVLPGSPALPPLPVGSTLVGSAESDITHLATNATGTIDRVNAALEQLQAALAAVIKGRGTTGKLVNDPELYDKSRAAVDKLEQVTDKGLSILSKVERGEGTVGKLMADQELYTRANQAVAALNELAGRLNNQNGTLARLADPALYARLDSLTSRGELLLGKLERGEGTAGKLITQDDLYARTDKLLTEVEEFVADVKKNPKKYFKFSVF